MSIDDIKKRRSLITNNGKWFIMHGEDLMGNCGYDEPDSLGWVKGGIDDSGQNADFVVHAPTDIDFLLAENERLTFALEVCFYQSSTFKG